MEDEALAALELRRMLEDLGHIVPAIASNATEAIARAEEHDPDLVLMDIRLQGKPRAGISAAGHIWQKLRTPVVYTTAYADEDTLEEATRTVPFGFLRKPFQLSDLRAAIQVALARRQSEAAEEAARRQAELRANQQAQIAKLGLAALTGLPLPKLMERAVATATELLKAQSALIAKSVTHQSALTIQAATGMLSETRDLAGVELSGSLYGYALDSPEPIVLQEIANEARFTLPSLLLEHELHGGICAPITPAGEPWGVMGVHASQIEAFTLDDVYFVQGIANIIASAIEREESGERILELSTPILPIGERLLMVPLVGKMNDQRITQLETLLLRAIHAKRAKAVIIDVTGAVSFDSNLATRLWHTIRAARLLGAEVVVTGISVELAQALTDEGDHCQELRTVVDLQGGITAAQVLLGDSRAQTG